jgi:hypothetical protein
LRPVMMGEGAEGSCATAFLQTVAGQRTPEPMVPGSPKSEGRL